MSVLRLLIIVTWIAISLGVYCNAVSQFRTPDLMDQGFSAFIGIVSPFVVCMLGKLLWQVTGEIEKWIRHE